MQELKNKIKGFVVENFLFGSDDGVEDNTSFLEEGIIDSTGILELITFIESEFSIKVLDDELIPENMDSIENIASFIQQKTEKYQATAV